MMISTKINLASLLGVCIFLFSDVGNVAENDVEYSVVFDGSKKLGEIVSERYNVDNRTYFEGNKKSGWTYERYVWHLDFVRWYNCLAKGKKIPIGATVHLPSLETIYKKLQLLPSMEKAALSVVKLDKIFDEILPDLSVESGRNQTTQYLLKFHADKIEKFSILLEELLSISNSNKIEFTESIRRDLSHVERLLESVRSRKFCESERNENSCYQVRIAYDKEMGMIRNRLNFLSRSTLRYFTKYSNELSVCQQQGRRNI